jgi:transcription antitermination factor NusG
MSSDWFVARIRTGKERAVMLMLRTKGREVFLPTRVIRKRWSDRDKVIEAPLFPGYLFVEGSHRPIQDILMTQGVMSIVTGPGGAPAEVDPREMSSLRVVSGGQADTMSEVCILGHKVTVVDGPLAGVEGKVLKIKDSYRLIISMSLLGRSVAVEISANSASLLSSSNMAIAPDHVTFDDNSSSSHQ